MAKQLGMIENSERGRQGQPDLGRGQGLFDNFIKKSVLSTQSGV
jgi:hypothetical protein